MIPSVPWAWAATCGAGQRDVSELATRLGVTQHQPTATHVAAADELLREVQALA